MKERPILFSTRMVQALDAGNKTMTRRTRGLEIVNYNPDDVLSATFFSGNNDQQLVGFRGKKNPLEMFCAVRCPYGKVGDILWVRETFFQDGDDYYYRACGTCCDQIPECACSEMGKPKWKPSIHMPKAAARTWLKITDIRVERLQDISDVDAIAEGIEVLPSWPEAPDKMLYKWYNYPTKELLGTHDSIVSFYTLWASINGEKSVIDNPWVWVIVFEKVDNPAMNTTGKTTDLLEAYN